MPTRTIYRPPSIPVAPCAIVGATLGVWLFYEQTLGWTAGAFLVCLALASTMRVRWARDATARRVLLIATLGLSVALFEQPTLLAMTCAIVSLGLLAMTCRVGWVESFAVWLRRWCALFINAFSRPFADLRISTRRFHRHPRSAGTIFRRSMLWAIPLALGSIFVLLFAAANPIVERWINQVFDQVENFIDSLDLWLQPGCIVLWLSFAGGIYALLRFRRRRMKSLPPILSVKPTLLGGALDSAAAGSIVVRCLIVFNAIFAVESVLDCLYLLGNQALPDGMTYIQYAHRGAYPLIATALLAGIFVLITFRDNSRTSTRRDARWLVYLWIAQNVGLTASAAWRLKLLVDHSDLTRLRLSTAIWLGLVSLGLISLMWRIARNRGNRWLIRVNASMAAITLYCCCFANLDGFIAGYNADRGDDLSAGGRTVSLDYLEHLGPSALPAVHSLVERLPTAARRSAARAVEDALASELQNELFNWRGWTWRRARLLANFEAHHMAIDAAGHEGGGHELRSLAPEPARTATESALNDLIESKVLPGSEKWCRIVRRRRLPSVARCRSRS